MTIPAVCSPERFSDNLSKKVILRWKEMDCLLQIIRRVAKGCNKKKWWPVQKCLISWQNPCNLARAQKKVLP